MGGKSAAPAPRGKVRPPLQGGVEVHPLMDSVEVMWNVFCIDTRDEVNLLISI